MGPTQRIQPQFSRVLAVAAVLCLTFVAWSLAVGSTPGAALAALGGCSAAAVLVWEIFWVPRVEVSDGGVDVVNPLRSVHVPWPALAQVESGWSLTLVTAQGGRVTAFAAPAAGALGAGSPAQLRHRGSRQGEEHFRADALRDATSRGSAPNGLCGEATSVITARRARLTDAGYLDDPRPEGAAVVTTWHRAAVAALAVSAAATLAGLLLR